MKNRYQPILSESLKEISLVRSYIRQILFSDMGIVKCAVLGLDANGIEFICPLAPSKAEKLNIKNTNSILMISDGWETIFFKQGYALVESQKGLEIKNFQTLGELNLEKLKKIYPEVTSLLAEFMIIEKSGQPSECWCSFSGNVLEEFYFKDELLPLIRNFIGEDCLIKESFE